MESTVVQKDKVGLFVTIGPWACRPLSDHPFSEGQEVLVEQLQGVTVGLRSALAPKGCCAEDVWLRCGHLDEHFGDPQKRRRDNFEFFKMFAGNVQSQKALLAAGQSPLPAGSEQPAAQPHAAVARAARP